MKNGTILFLCFCLVASGVSGTLPWIFLALLMFGVATGFEFLARGFTTRTERFLNCMLALGALMAILDLSGLGPHAGHDYVGWPPKKHPEINQYDAFHRLILHCYENSMLTDRYEYMATEGSNWTLRNYISVGLGLIETNNSNCSLADGIKEIDIQTGKVFRYNDITNSMQLTKTHWLSDNDIKSGLFFPDDHQLRLWDQDTHKVWFEYTFDQEGIRHSICKDNALEGEYEVTGLNTIRFSLKTDNGYSHGGATFSGNTMRLYLDKQDESHTAEIIFNKKY